MNKFFVTLMMLFYSCVIVAQDVTSVRKGAYEVYYSVFNSSFLQPETAVAIGVKRAKNIALINLSMLEHLPDGTTKARKASAIKGSSFNLIHKNNLDFQEIVEPGAVYYLAKFKISNDNEMIVIKASLSPENSTEVIDVEFEHHFYLN
jgi:hypothetical protein